MFYGKMLDRAWILWHTSSTTRGNAKEHKEMRRHAKACKDVLRSVWISELQDRYHHSTDESMRAIITHVDAKICNMTEHEAEELI